MYENCGLLLYLGSELSILECESSFFFFLIDCMSLHSVVKEYLKDL